MSEAPMVSVVIPTCNRLSRLQRAVEAIRRQVTLPTEVIVVDGASDDGTAEWLAAQADLETIREPRREGAEAAVEMIERPDLTDVGMVAFYHSWDRQRNILDSVVHEGKRYSIYNVRGYPYANFGLLRRELLERIGFADERYYFFAFDPDLSLTIQIDHGLKVIGCRRALIHHDEHHDDRKLEDLTPGEDDNRKLFAKWSLPEKDSYPDPGPAYREMLRRRGLAYPEAEVTHQVHT